MNDPALIMPSSATSPANLSKTIIMCTRNSMKPKELRTFSIWKRKGPDVEGIIDRKKRNKRKKLQSLTNTTMVEKKPFTFD